MSQCLVVSDIQEEKNKQNKTNITKRKKSPILVRSGIVQVSNQPELRALTKDEVDFACYLFVTT